MIEAIIVKPPARRGRHFCSDRIEGYDCAENYRSNERYKLGNLSVTPFEIRGDRDGQSGVGRFHVI